MQDRNEKRISGRLRRLVQTVKWWLSKPSTNADAVGVGAALIVLGIVAAWALNTLRIIDLSGQTAAWALPIILGGIFAVGILANVRRRRHLMPEKQEVLAANVVALEHERTRWKSEHDRLSVYLKYVKLLLAHDPGAGADREGVYLLEPAKLLGAQVGETVYVSLWQNRRGPDRIMRLEPTLWPMHAPREQHDFATPNEESWIAYMSRQHPKGEVFGITDLTESMRWGGGIGADLSAFREHGFRSLACCSISFEENMRSSHCLVMVAKKANCFSRGDYRFLEIVAGFLAKDLQMSNGGLEDGVAP